MCVYIYIYVVCVCVVCVRCVCARAQVNAIHRKWVHPAQTIANEIWVPAHFLVDPLVDAGVAREKVVVMPEMFDHTLYNPDATTKMEIQGVREFNFLSVV